MDPLSALCPECQQRLRVRERAFLNRPIDCPACGAPIRIDVASDGTIAVTRVTPQPAEPIAPSDKAPSEPHEPAPSPRDTAFQLRGALIQGTLNGTASPRLIAWTAAIAVGAIALGWVWWSRPPRPAQPAMGAQPAVDVPPPGSAPSPETAGADRSLPPGSSTPAIPAKPRRLEPAELLAARMTNLGRELVAFHDVHNVFPFSQPESLPPSQRLSWIASLSAATARPGPRIDLAWNALENEPFVRRRRDELLNPFETSLVGDDGFPSTHFAGSAGVGLNARKLRVDEPGAGAFGEDRQTRRDDFRDGLGNTILIVGAADHHGSWAANDRATLREFTREPYVNGPDGIGTGQPDSMLVLMADGSVRTISSRVEGAVVRQLVTLWDDAPSASPDAVVAANVPDGAGESPASPPVPREPATPTDDPPTKADATDNKPDQPVGPSPDPEEPSALPPAPAVVIQTKLSIENALRRTVLKYEVKQPVERAVLLRELADLAGITITWDEAALGERGASLKEAVTLTAGPVSLDALIDRLLSPAGLRLDPRDGAAWIIPAPGRPAKPPVGSRLP